MGAKAEAKRIVILAACGVCWVLAHASTLECASDSAPGPAKTTATQARQSPVSAAASVIGALGSLVPGLLTNVAPLVVLFGLGALMMPALGMGAMGLLRESRRR